jgi:hypothetical protein
MVRLSPRHASALLALVKDDIAWAARTDAIVVVRWSARLG